MKFVETKVTFSEVPNEISLCINISGCPFRCPGCHSSWLQENSGEELTRGGLQKLLDSNLGITCVCLMGGQEEDILSIIPQIKENNLKIAWYTGQENLPGVQIQRKLDFLKVGPYISEKGPLTSETTNQVFYKIEHIQNRETGEFEDILHDETFRFWK